MTEKSIWRVSYLRGPQYQTTALWGYKSSCDSPHKVHTQRRDRSIMAGCTPASGRRRIILRPVGAARLEGEFDSDLWVLRTRLDTGVLKEDTHISKRTHGDTQRGYCSFRQGYILVLNKDTRDRTTQRWCWSTTYSKRENWSTRLPKHLTMTPKYSNRIPKYSTIEKKYWQGAMCACIISQPRFRGFNPKKDTSGPHFRWKTIKGKAKSSKCRVLVL